MTSKAPLLAAFLALSGCSGADAADALQTVAYMTFGIEEGEGMRKTSDTPLSYTGKDVDFSIDQKDDCNYDFLMVFRERNGKEVQARFALDFLKVTGLAILPNSMGMGSSPFVTKIQGATMTCGDGELSSLICSAFEKSNTLPFTSGKADRQQKAFEHFRADICKPET